MTHLTTVTNATNQLIEVAAVRIAQMHSTHVDQFKVAYLVRNLRQAVPEWRDAYGPDAVAALVERFGIACDNPTELYFYLSGD